VPVRLGGLTTELSVVLVPLLLMLLTMPSEPFVRPAAALRSLLGGMAPDVAVPALVAPGTSVAFSPSVALERLEAARGTQFDPIVVDAMIDVVTNRG